jgi:hypothetical protein
MNRNAEKWVAALESGEFAQTQSQLYDPDTDAYCCLGVACEVARREGAIEWYEGTLGGLPDVVRVWLGLNGNLGSYQSAGERTYLTDDNDCHGRTFPEIAAIIRSEPEGLFGER